MQRNRNAQLRLRALQEIAASRDAEAFDTAIDIMAGWPRDERREGVKIMLQALAERRIGRRDQANAWIWRMAEYTREVHEEYAVQRWPETKRLLGLLVNSSGAAHARNARRLVHATRKEDRRLAAALLAAALAHTPEAEEALRGARTRMARKPAALARELLRNFPKGRRGNKRRRRKAGANGSGAAEAEEAVVTAARSRRPTSQGHGEAEKNGAGPAAEFDDPEAPDDDDDDSTTWTTRTTLMTAMTAMMTMTRRTTTSTTPSRTSPSRTPRPRRKFRRARRLAVQMPPTKGVTVSTHRLATLAALAASARSQPARSPPPAAPIRRPKLLAEPDP